MKYILNKKYIKNNFKWSDEKWLIIQIILELTIPNNNDDYVFTKQSLYNSLKNINVNDIIPFYHIDSKYKQSENEKNLIISYYKYHLGFPDDFLSENYNIIDNNIINKVIDNIINKSLELKLAYKI